MASGNAIASGAAVLTADADGLIVGLNKGSAGIKAWGARTTATMNAVASRADSVFKTLSSGLIKGLGAGAGFAGFSGAEEVARSLLDTVKDVAKQGDIAKALGLTSEQFTGIAGVAKSVGENTREFLESLVTLGKLGTEAAAGIGETAGPAFEKLGLDAKEFIKLRADEQFFKMFEALKKVEDPLARTRLLMNAFGEDGGKFLLPLLSKSDDQLRKMAAGFAVSSDAMKKSTAAAAEVAAKQVELNRLWLDFATSTGPDFAKFATGAAKFLTDFLTPAVAQSKELLATTKALGEVKWAGNKTDGIGDFAGGFLETISGSSSLNPLTRANDVLANTNTALQVGGMLFAQKLDEFQNQLFKKGLVGSPSNRADDLAMGLAGENAARQKSAMDAAAKAEEQSQKWGGFLGSVVQDGVVKPMKDGVASAEKISTLWAFAGDTLNKVAPGIGQLAMGARDLTQGVLKNFGEGAGAWAGKMIDKDDGKRFAGAMEKGSREAYSLTLRNQFPEMDKDKDVNKENGRKLEKIENRLIDLNTTFERWTESVGVV